MSRYAHKIVASRFVLHNLFKQPRSDCWYFRARDLRTNQVVVRSTRLTQRRAAEAEAIRHLEELARRSDGRATEEVLFRDAFAEWLSTKTVKPRTAAEYQKDFVGVYLPVFGHRILSHVEPIEIQQWLTALDRERNNSSRTRRKHLAQIRAFFRWAREVRRLVTEDPTAGLRVERGPKKRAARALTREEVLTLLVAARQPFAVKRSGRRNAGSRKGGVTTRGVSEWKETRHPPPELWIALLIAFHTGLRKENVFGLKWSDHVDLARRRIHLTASEMKASRDHHVPIHRELELALRRQWEICGAPGGYVLGSRVTTLRRSFNGAVSRAKLGRMRWHDTRHTFGTLYAAAGTTYEVLQALLGHRPTEVTWDYLHPPWESLVAAVDRFRGFFEDSAAVRAWIAMS